MLTTNKLPLIKKKSILISLAVFLILAVVVAGFLTFRGSLSRSGVATKDSKTQMESDGSSPLSGLMGDDDSEQSANTQEEIAAQKDDWDNLATNSQVTHQDLPPAESSDQPMQQQASASLVLQSSTNSIKVGEPINFEVVLQSSVVPDGIQFQISYDSAAVESVRIEQVNTFGSYLAAKVNDEEGLIQAILVRDPPEQVDVSQTHTLLRISGIAREKGQLSFEFVEEETMVAALSGNDILDSVRGVSLQVK